MGKIQRPKIAKNNMPAPFIMTKPLAKKGKKNFQAFTKDHEAITQQKNDNFFQEKLNDAVDAEEYNKMRALL